MTALFSKLIKCSYCSKFHKKKKVRNNNIVYVCSTYDNYGKNHCQRNKVDETLLLEMLSLRYDKLISEREEILEKVELICIDEDKIEIIVKDGESIILSNTYGQF